MNIMNLKGAGKAAPREGGFNLVTGIGAVYPLAVNPSNDEYAAITGNELPYTLTYDVREVGDLSFRPINILVKSVENPDIFGFLRFSISNQQRVSKAGDKVESIDPRGVQAWNLVEGNVDYDWFDAPNSVPMVHGEGLLHNFLQKLTRYDNSAPDSNWMEALNSINLTAQKLYSGDVSGIRSFIEYANSQELEGRTGFTVGALWMVTETPRKDKDTGEEIPGQWNYNQIINNRYFFYTDDKGAVTSGSYKTLKNIEEKQEKDGYPLDNLYTYKFQSFVKEECRNVAPEETVEEPTTSGNSADFFSA